MHALRTNTERRLPPNVIAFGPIIDKNASKVNDLGPFLEECYKNKIHVIYVAFGSSSYNVLPFIQSLMKTISQALELAVTNHPHLAIIWAMKPGVFHDIPRPDHPRY